jgi:tetratricopeptide (TPR) repeat protein
MLPATALGQSGDVRAAEARARYEEGVQAFSKGRYDEALVKFQQACTANETKRCPKNMGLALLELRRYSEAATLLRKYLKDPHADDARDARIMGLLREKLTNAQGRVGEVEIDASPGWMISIDGKTNGIAPLGETIFLEPGAHAVVAKKDGAELNARVDVPAGSKQTVKLQEATPVPPPPAAPIASQTNPQPPTQVADRIEPRKTVWPPPTGVVVLGGLTVASVLGGVGFLLHGNSKAEAVDNLRASRVCSTAGSSGCSDLQQALEDRDRSSALSTILFAVGGVAAVGGAVWWMLAPRDATKSTTWIAPRVGGVEVGGHF